MDAVAGDPVGSGGIGDLPEPVEHCALCRWEEHCAARREADDHLSLVARIQRSQRTRLAERGIETMAQLAAAEPADRPKRIGAGTFDTLRAQARLQLRRAHDAESYATNCSSLRRGAGSHICRRRRRVTCSLTWRGTRSSTDGLEYLFGCVFLNHSTEI